MFKKLIAIAFYFLCFASFAGNKLENNAINSIYYTNVLKNKPAFVLSHDINRLYTPYYVTYDYKNGKCDIYYNHKKKKFDTSLVKFAIYHEASHCVLYQEGIIYKDLPDFFALLMADSITFQQDKKVGYMYFYELYADSLATALMLKEGNNKEIIHKVIQMRLKSPFGVHQTEKLLETVLDIDWSSRTIIEIKKEVLKLTEDYFIEVWGKNYFKSEIENKNLPVITTSLIKSFWYEQQLKMTDEKKIFYESSLSGFSKKMYNPHYKLLELMYKNRKASTVEIYMKAICSKGDWCQL